MSRVYIVTDSTADLTEEEVKQFEISIVPMNISIDDDNYIDGVTITKEEFKQKKLVILVRLILRWMAYCQSVSEKRLRLLRIFMKLIKCIKEKSH